MTALIEAGSDRWGYELIRDILFEEYCESILIKALLNAGAHVNEGTESLLIPHYDPNEEGRKLLFVAREKGIPNYFPVDLQDPWKMNLMSLCREVIREHLLQMSNVNLLFRVPKLELPSQITQYLLYNVSSSATDDEPSA